MTLNPRQRGIQVKRQLDDRGYHVRKSEIRYGIYRDNVLVEGGFFSRAAAEIVAETHRGSCISKEGDVP